MLGVTMIVSDKEKQIIDTIKRVVLNLESDSSINEIIGYCFGLLKERKKK